MSGHTLSPERKDEVLTWWRGQQSPTIYACHVATGVNDKTIRKILTAEGLQWSHTQDTRRSLEKKAAIAEWRTKLAALHAQAYSGLYIDPVIRPKFPVKVLFCPDSHGNYWDAGVTETMLRRDGDATLVVTNEIMTVDAFSHFRQEYESDLMGELMVTGAFVEMLRHGEGGKRQVVISNSNHQERFVKFVSDHASTSQAVKASAEMWAAAMHEYASIKAELTNGFVVQVGRAIFGHPDSYLMSQGGVAARFLQRCTSRYPEYALEPPFTFCAVGHPHRLNLTQAIGTRAFVAEAGSQCHVPRYAVRDNSTRPCTLFPIVNGYVSVTFDRLGNVESFNIHFVKFATVPGRE
jgi:hypothetical protein